MSEKGQTCLQILPSSIVFIVNLVALLLQRILIRGKSFRKNQLTREPWLAREYGDYEIKEEHKKVWPIDEYDQTLKERKIDLKKKGKRLDELNLRMAERSKSRKIK